ncbi:MAG: primosomal protein N' [Flavobacteriaceae bacterium]|nr:primosomal protein N' [Flavobacteriaceae bacterium]
MYYAQIILPLNLKGTFTYKVPQDLLGEIELGKRVLIPFGGKKIYTGIVSEIHQNFPETFTAKEIISVLDSVPIVPKEQLEFWSWLSGYYLCNLGEIYRFAFPSSLKLESETYLKLNPNKTANLEDLDANEINLLQALEVKQLLNLQEIEAFIPKKQIIKTINSLLDEQLIFIDEKITEKYKIKEVSYLKINNNLLNSNELVGVLTSLDKAPKQKELFLLILSEQKNTQNQLVKKSEVLGKGNFSSAQLKALLDKNLVEEYLLETDRIQKYDGDLENIESLSPVQLNAKNEIDKSFSEGKNVLLHGVTSSGKTHIYLEKIEECLEEGKNALFLLPEIALTKQIIQRLEKKYGKSLGFYHQKLTDFEKVEVWRKVKSNEIKILIGTRNALFLPFSNLGLIIIDEEHDSAYKSKDSQFFFNAKDAGLVLAKFYNAKVILGSATPSLETYYAAQKGKIHYVYLGERFGNVELPIFELIDLKEELSLKNVKGNFSLKMIENIQQQVENQKQVIVLHNRRGYANVVECKSCGYVAYCGNCDVVLTYHKSENEMKCHYCGQKAMKPATCPKCHSENMSSRGVGVEQIQEEMQGIFPDYQIDRMDIDAMRKKFAYEKLYEKIENGETDIVVGTQMISKGLDFQNIELVAIPKADSLLHIQDFRAEERAYQLITQVSGRAGRSSGKGKVLIQTYNTENSVFQLIKENDKEKIYQYFLQERKKFLYPPFTKIIFIELKHRREEKVQRASAFLGSVLRKYLPEQCIFGPEKAPVGKINNLYVFQILMKLPRGKKYEEFKQNIVKSLEEFGEITAYRSVNIKTFVDY